MRNARGEQEEQISQVNDFIEAGYDGIIVNLVDTDHAGVIADSCHKAGIPLVFINREPKADEQARWKAEKMAVPCIGTDSKQAGTYQGDIILGDGYARRFKPRRNRILCYDYGGKG